MSEYLSYAQFVKDYKNFKRAGTKRGNEFNLYDTPSNKFFKILFYFGGKADSVDDGLSSGLLAPTWDIIENPTEDTPYYDYNSAWAYLKMNAEDERANMLKQFVTLLSNISTYSPWYFQSISGLDAAINRAAAELGAEKFELEMNRKLTINCIPDAFDNRLTTLLDLYREIVWSWHQKKEIVPSNLRKFDMAVYIFESPVMGWHKTDENNYTTLDGYGTQITSYKMLEFHDCEINYNSSKSAWGEISNETGISPKYSIEISYGDCFEISYNDMIKKELGDVIISDTYTAVINDGIVTNIEKLPSSDTIQYNEKINTKSSPLTSKIEGEINKEIAASISSNKIITYGNLENNTRGEQSIRQEKIEYQPGFLSNTIGQAVGHVTKNVKSFFKKAVLGNLYTYSLTQIGSQLKSASEGNVIKAAQTIKQYRKNAQQRAAAKQKAVGNNIGNIFKDSTIANNI